jgi:transposase
MSRKRTLKLRSIGWNLGRYCWVLNASFHNKEDVRQLLEPHGHMLLPLPPYSPDFNPIEESFAILKKRRRFAQTALTLEQLIVSSIGLE